MYSTLTNKSLSFLAKQLEIQKKRNEKEQEKAQKTAQKKQAMKKKDDSDSDEE